MFFVEMSNPTPTIHIHAKNKLIENARDESLFVVKNVSNAKPNATNAINQMNVE